jgi:hypothetical protein
MSDSEGDDFQDDHDEVTEITADDVMSSEDEEENEEENDEEENDEEENEDEENDISATAAATSVKQQRNFMYSGAAPELQECEENIIISPDDRRTSNILSRVEFTELLSLSIERIAREGIRGSLLDEMPPGATSAREIAIAEINARRSPYKLIRIIGTETDAHGITKKYVEQWSPNDMTYPRTY